MEPVADLLSTAYQALRGALRLGTLRRSAVSPAVCL